MSEDKKTNRKAAKSIGDIRKFGADSGKKSNIKTASKQKNDDSKENQRKKPQKIHKPRRSRQNSANNTANQKNGELSLIEGGKSPKNLFKKYIAFALAAALIIAVAAFCFTRPTGIGEWIKTAMASTEKGDGFPVFFDDFNADGIYSANGQLYALGDTQMRCYSSTGGVIYSRFHGFTSPSIRFSKIRALTFDRGGTQARIDTLSDEISAFSVSHKIIDGDIADNGSYVLATFSDNEAALVTVYDKNGNEKYRFHSAENQISSVSISPNGKLIAVCSLSAKNSVMNSSVMIYSINSTDALSTKTFSDETVYSVQFYNNSSLRAVSTKRLFTMNKNGGYNEKEFGSQVLVKFRFENGGNTLVCLSGALNSSSNTIMLVKPDMTNAAEFTADCTVDGICVSNDKIYVLSTELYAYSYSGERQSANELNAGAYAICGVFGKAAVLYPASIELY